MAVSKVKKKVSDKVDDRYYVQLYNPVDGGRYKKVVRGKRNAERHEAEMKGKLSGGGVAGAADRGKTVEIYMNEILAAKKTLAANTRRSYGNHLRLHIIPELGDQKVSSLTRELPLVGFFAAVEKTAGKATRRSVESLVRLMLKTAVREGILSKNPLDGVPFPKAIRVRGVPYAPELIDVHRMRAHVLTQKRGVLAGEPEMMLAAVDGLTGLGVRIGELLGLSEDDLDREKKTITLRRQLVHIAGEGYVFGPPKTDDSGFRVIPVPQFVLAALSATLLRNGAQDVTLPWEELDAEEKVTVSLIFHNLRRPGQHIQHTTLSNRLARLTGLLNLAGGLHAHSFRHRYATTLTDGGVPQIVIDYITGHLPAGSVTMTTYTRATQEGLAKARQVMEDSWAAARVEHDKKVARTAG